MDLRHGIFLAPFHALDENPTLCFERDLELLEMLDGLGFSEAWIGEHHSAGMETIDSPEIFIAAAAERTKHLRFGTGVVSLPYHHPLNVANRIIQLDHMTRGRIMFGGGPGLLASDALMMGIEPEATRDRMAEALDVILRLFRGEAVTEKTEWYTMRDARVHLMPYTHPHPEVCVASAVTPSGGRLAGKYDLGMLCVAAGESEGFSALDTNWAVANEIAAEHGRTMDRGRLRIVLNMHLADSREQAKENIRFGTKQFVDYFNNNMPRLHVPEGCRPRRLGDRAQGRGGGHRRRRDRANRAGAREAGRVRLPAPASEQLGAVGGDAALVRALCALRDAPFQWCQRQPLRVLRLGHRTSGRARREASRGSTTDVRQARGGAEREGECRRHRSPGSGQGSMVSKR